jgi:myosin regulatory light chain 12
MMETLLTARPGNGGALSPSEDGKTRGVNFTMFLTMMGEHLLELDSEAELLEAFESFDENDDGKVKCDEIRRWLSEAGERMDHEEVHLDFGGLSIMTIYHLDGLEQIDRLLKGPFTDRQGYFNYREWVKVLRVNADESHEAEP